MELVVIRTEGPAGFIELNRPDKANAYLSAMLQVMEQGLTRLVHDPQVRVIVVASTSAGTFCGGADLGEVRGRRDPAEALNLQSLRVFDALAACPRPTLAAIDGPALGGGLELALACDLRLATPRACFGLPETGLGLLPAAGGTLRLPQVAGEAAARQVILFGHRLDAQQALQCGLVSEVVPPEELQGRVQHWVRSAASRDPLALRLAKQAMQMTRVDAGGRAFAACAQALLYQRQGLRRGEGGGPDSPK